MVQSNRIERFDTAIVPLMNETEARECVNAINGHMNSARALLLDLYERRGWVALGYQSWRECVMAEFEGSQRTLYYALQAAQIERNIQPVLQDIAKMPIPETQLRPLAALTPMEQPVAWEEANERASGKPTARVVEQVVSEMIAEPREVWQPEPHNVFTDPKAEHAEAVRATRMNVGMFTSATPEWYTPNHILDLVESVFGHIDLDPCSNSNNPTEANVPALNYWTQADNGLIQPWHGKVYMNPPYGDEIGAWVQRLIRAYNEQEIYEGIALLPARTDTAWFQPLFDFSICFVRGRLRFSGADNSAPFPSAVVYLGADTTVFSDYFHAIGRIK
jgi:hypothetical protein